MAPSALGPAAVIVQERKKDEDNIISWFRMDAVWPLPAHGGKCQARLLPACRRVCVCVCMRTLLTLRKTDYAVAVTDNSQSKCIYIDSAVGA
jgi:hypothetical protein